MARQKAVSAAIAAEAPMARRSRGLASGIVIPFSLFYGRADRKFLASKDGVRCAIRWRKPSAKTAQAISALGVTCRARENSRRVIPIPCPIPQKQRARDVAFGGGEFRGEGPAADLQSHGGIAERGERCVRETVFARDLAHHLHQPPRKCAGARFGGVGDSASRNLRRNGFFLEGRLRTQAPR